jgi:transcription elongation factor GreA
METCEDMPRDFTLTPQGYQKLQDELAQLQGPRRAELVERVKVARAHGDLSENFDYHDAKKHLAILDGRIIEIQRILERATIVENTGTADDGTIGVGSVVTLLDTERASERIISIVGDFEANPDKGEISSTSPLAKALLGHKLGDTVEVVTPARRVVYQIIDVHS